MTKFRIAAALIFGIGLSACQSGPTVYTDKHTAMKIYYGSKSSAFSGLLSFAHGQPFYEPSKNVWGIEIQYVGTEWWYLNSAWSYGKKLKYIGGARTVMGCSSGSCSIQEVGLVILSEADFRRAATEGFEFAVKGTAGSFDGKLPASSFRETLELAGK